MSGKETVLGAGVRVLQSADGSLLVTSEHLDLGWQEGHGNLPGAAVAWQEELYAVSSRRRAGSGHVWTLQPWPATQAQRAMFRLDRAAVDKAEQAYHKALQGARRRRWLAPFLPLLGLAPGHMQRRWWNEWGFPAPLAVTLSCVVELLLGAAGLIQGFVVAFGGEYFLPGWLHWLAVVGPVLFAEGLIRMVVLVSQGEPIGSLLGAPLQLLEKKLPAPASELLSNAPQLRRFDAEQGLLELWSSDRRTDWDAADGLLPYRGQQFLLVNQRQEGRGWCYSFTVAGDTTGDRPTLRLLPPLQRRDEQQRQEQQRAGLPVGPLRMILVTTLVCLAPRRFQERWAARIAAEPMVLTLMGAGAELLGGLSQIRADHQAGSPFLLLDLLLIGDALYRLGVVALTRQAATSLLGLPLTALFERLTK